MTGVKLLPHPSELLPGLAAAWQVLTPSSTLGVICQHTYQAASSLLRLLGTSASHGSLGL